MTENKLKTALDGLNEINRILNNIESISKDSRCHGLLRQAIAILDAPQPAESVEEQPKQPDVNAELLGALKELAPFELVHGDTIQRTNPHSRQMLNSSATWAVSVGNRSALRVRNAIECINQFIASAEQKVCPDCGGAGWYKEDAAPVTRVCKCAEQKGGV